MQQLRRLCSGLAAPGGVAALLAALSVRHPQHSSCPCLNPAPDLCVDLSNPLTPPKTLPAGAHDFVRVPGLSTQFPGCPCCRMTLASPPSSSSTAALWRASNRTLSVGAPSLSLDVLRDTFLLQAAEVVATAGPVASCRCAFPHDSLESCPLWVALDGQCCSCDTGSVSGCD